MSLKLAPLSTDWGVQLHAVALQRGINSVLHTPYTPPSPGRTIFARLPQKAPEAARTWALKHIRSGGKSVQSVDDLLCYENRGQQMATLADWMPAGERVRTMEAAEEAIEVLGLPIVSKAPFGSSSKTVRLLGTHKEALAEARTILNGRGMVFPGWPTQYGECLWQRFLPGNEYSLRVARITKRWGWAFKVMNRPHDWRASGSGNCVPLTAAEWASPHFRYAIHTALHASDHMGSRWCGFDLLLDRNPEAPRWRIVDTTLAWNLQPKLLGANYDAPVYDLHTFEPHPQGLLGRSQWEILLDDLLEMA